MTFRPGPLISVAKANFMCLIFLALDAHPKFPLVIAANRDEFYDRPTAPASFWADAPELLAGQDLRAGGTWLGITRTGRIAALTNFRDPKLNRADAPSRGKLVADFLLSSETPALYLERLSHNSRQYNGFTLLTGERGQFYWYSNRGNAIRKLSSGIHGLSNHLVDTPWPKVSKGKEEMSRILAQEQVPVEGLFALLLDRTIVQDTLLPDTGVGLEWERILSPVFISSPTYGTRSSTVILVDQSGAAAFTERTFEKDVGGCSTAERSFTLSLDFVP
jgi:uncharacterized protein with NRDE domain